MQHTNLFIKIEIKFQIDINNNKILKTTWKHNKKKKVWMSMVVCSNKAQVWINAIDKLVSQNKQGVMLHCILFILTTHPCKPYAPNSFEMLIWTYFTMQV
jgi:hypothetical protein